MSKAPEATGRTAVYLFDEIEVLDLGAPVEVFSVVIRWISRTASICTGAFLLAKAGISAAIDMTLHLVGRLQSHQLAIRKAR